MSVKIRALAAVPTAVLLFALVGCGGSDSSDSAGSATAPASADSAQGAGAAAGEAGGEKDEKAEPPLTGEVKAQAEKAAQAAVPGTVVKSEEDAEKPGMYAVEIKKADGTTVEVYLDKSFKVVETEQEGAEEKEENAG